MRLTSGSQPLVADGVVLGMHEGEPFRLDYEIRCDESGRSRRLEAALCRASGTSRLAIAGDRRGIWHDRAGGPRGEIRGCLDLDIAATPFTNTLAIRRLGLEIGQGADVSIAYVELPRLSLSTARQRYTRLAERRYRYESLSGALSAELEVDRHQLVRDYPATFRRVV